MSTMETNSGNAQNVTLPVRASDQRTLACTGSMSVRGANYWTEGNMWMGKWYATQNFCLLCICADNAPTGLEKNRRPAARLVHRCPHVTAEILVRTHNELKRLMLRLGLKLMQWHLVWIYSNWSPPYVQCSVRGANINCLNSRAHAKQYDDGGWWWRIHV